MFCPKCGKEIVEGSVFCPACGSSINETKEIQQPVSVINENQPKSSMLTKTLSEKSRLCAFLLAFILGVFGAHNFYLGKTGCAVAQLILTLTFFGAIVSSIWALIDWIIILCGNMKDGDGLQVKKWLDN